jgi:hypothetical protein
MDLVDNLFSTGCPCSNIGITILENIFIVAVDSYI